MPAMLDTYNRLNLDCLVVMGGNGTQKSAKLLSDAGMNIVTLPKTIDNDIYGTDTTFGFQSAVDIGTNVIDYIHSTASSHSRVFLVELMGRDAGWLTLNAGIASGADIILIPEIPYNIEKVAEALEERRRSGRNFSIIAVAEGAVSDTDAVMSEEERRRAKEQSRHSTISYRIASELEEMTGQETRVTVPGHYQRGGPPCPLRPRAGHPVRHRRRAPHNEQAVRHHGRHPQRADSLRPARGRRQPHQVPAHRPPAYPGGQGHRHPLRRLIYGQPNPRDRAVPGGFSYPLLAEGRGGYALAGS